MTNAALLSTEPLVLLTRTQKRVVFVSVEVAYELARAPLIGFLASNGGAGATTLACHFASILHQVTNQKVLLVDLDVTASGAGFCRVSRAASGS